MKNYYKVLNVDTTSTTGEIKDAYRIMLKQLSHGNLSDQAREVAILDLELAYTTLQQSNKRAEYDRLMLSAMKHNAGRKVSNLNDEAIKIVEQKPVSTPHSGMRWVYLSGAIAASVACIFVLNKNRAFQQSDLQATQISAHFSANIFKQHLSLNPAEKPVESVQPQQKPIEIVTTQSSSISKKKNQTIDQPAASSLEHTNDIAVVNKAAAETLILPTLQDAKRNKEDVLSALGTPETIIKVNDQELWHYPNETFRFKRD